MEYGTPLPTPVWLYVFKSEGCMACLAAEPHLRKLKATYPLRVMVVELYLNRREWNILGWTPTHTPGYALVERENGEKWLSKKRVGVMEFDELVEWIGKERLS